MDNLETIKLLSEENKQLKERLFEIETELHNMKTQIDASKIKTKQYYENNKEKIIERVKEYNKNNHYKPIVTSEKKKEYNKIAYLKKKEKDKLY
jgi:uncharacterized protein YkuJ